LTVGGAPSVRKYWSTFIQDTRILMYVVDSADEKRLPESFDELHRLLGDERLSHVPIIIVANKQV
jgi:ADP-ribosylation factor-like protein 3